MLTRVGFRAHGWNKGGNVTSAGWQVTLCDPMWHVSSRSRGAENASTGKRKYGKCKYNANLQSDKKKV